MKRTSNHDGPLLGAHMSIEGGTPNAIARALSVGSTAMQIFVKNNNRWQGKTITKQEAAEFRNQWADSGLRALLAHSSYLINLASPDKDLWQRSVGAMLDELDRCARLGVSHLVTHPGAHVGEGQEKGIRRIAKALDRIHQTADSGVKIALETTAGQGTSIGFQFEELRDILALCKDPQRVEICLDTCHVFAAGYDLRHEEGYHATLEEFDALIGLQKLCAVHVNDSKRDLGSRVDRHEHIGKGKIGSAGFGFIMKDARLARVPKILETPKGKDLKEDRKNIRLLKKLARA